MKTAKQIYDYIVNNDYGRGTYGTQKTIMKHARIIEDNLMVQENVLVAWVGMYSPGAKTSVTSAQWSMVFVLTDKRIMWGQKNIIGSNTNSVMISKVNDISLTKGLAFSYLTIDSLKEAFTCIISTKKKSSVQNLYLEIMETFEKIQTK